MLRVRVAVTWRPASARGPPCPARAARVAHGLALGEKHRDAPLRRLRHALDQRPVDFLRPARAEDRAELGRDLSRLGDQQHARSVAIEPMDKNGPIAVLVGERLQHAVDVALGSRAALDREAVGLVEHDDVAVLEQRHRPDRLAVAGTGAPDRRACPAAGRSGGTRTLSPAASRVDTSARLPETRTSPLRTIFIRCEFEQVRKSAVEPAVEPHARFVLADLIRGGLVGLGRRDGGKAIAIFPHEAGHSAAQRRRDRVRHEAHSGIGGEYRDGSSFSRGRAGSTTNRRGCSTSASTRRRRP